MPCKTRGGTLDWEFHNGKRYTLKKEVTLVSECPVFCVACAFASPVIEVCMSMMDNQAS